MKASHPLAIKHTRSTVRVVVVISVVRPASKQATCAILGSCSGPGEIRPAQHFHAQVESIWQSHSTFASGGSEVLQRHDEVAMCRFFPPRGTMSLLVPGQSSSHAEFLHKPD
jgi:hypothetical protein